MTQTNAQLRERMTQAFIEQDRATDDATKLEDRVDLAIEVLGECRPVMMCRPEVAAFAMLMEAQFKANDHKPGWGNDSLLSLHERLEEESRELWGEIRPDPDTGIAAYDHDAIEKEAADVANFAMMIVSNLGALRKYTALLSPPDTGLASVVGLASKAERLIWNYAIANIPNEPDRENARQICEQLRALTTGGSGWRDDMENAPRDGTEVLILWNGKRYVVQWERIFGPTEGWVCRQMHNETQSTTLSFKHEDVSAWMPLPPEPETGGG